MPKKRLKPRSIPKQERSRKTRAEILEATARLLNKMDEADVTTNHIAKTTGISVGTLYKHYPNKDAILSDLIELYIEKDMQDLRARLNEVEEKDSDDFIDHLIEQIIETHKKEHKLRSVLYSNLGRLMKNTRAFEARHEIASQIFSSKMKIPTQDPTQILLAIIAINSMIHTLSQLPDSNQNWSRISVIARAIFLSE